MSTPVTKTPEPPEHRSWIEGKLAKGVAFGGAVAFSIGSAVTSIRNEFYDMMKNTEPFKTYRDTRLKRVDKATVECVEGTITLPERIAEVRAANKQFAHDFFDVGLPKLGINTQGGFEEFVKGTMQRWERIGPQKKQKIGLTFVGSVTVALGGLMLMNQNAKLKNELRNVGAHMDDQLDR